MPHYLEENAYFFSVSYNNALLFKKSTWSLTKLGNYLSKERKEWKCENWCNRLLICRTEDKFLNLFPKPSYFFSIHFKDDLLHVTFCCWTSAWDTYQLKFSFCRISTLHVFVLAIFENNWRMTFISMNWKTSLFLPYF